jgi:hypothetical protein
MSRHVCKYSLFMGILLVECILASCSPRPLLQLYPGPPLPPTEVATLRMPYGPPPGVFASAGSVRIIQVNGKSIRISRTAQLLPGVYVFKVETSFTVATSWSYAASVVACTLEKGKVYYLNPVIENGRFSPRCVLQGEYPRK